MELQTKQKLMKKNHKINERIDRKLEYKKISKVNKINERRVIKP